jgi:hypothetical protein
MLYPPDVIVFIFYCVLAVVYVLTVCSVVCTAVSPALRWLTAVEYTRCCIQSSAVYVLLCPAAAVFLLLFKCCLFPDLASFPLSNGASPAVWLPVVVFLLLFIYKYLYSLILLLLSIHLSIVVALL